MRHDCAMLTAAVADSRLLQRAPQVLRWRYPIIVVAAFAFGLPNLRRGDTDWVWFIVGSKYLFGEYGPVMGNGGLDLYAMHPAIQIGPLALVLAKVFRFVGDGRVIAMLGVTAVAPVLVYVLERCARKIREVASDAQESMFQLTVLVGGIMFVQGWAQLSVFSHLDDALVLAFAVLGVWAVTNGRPVVLGIALGFGLAAKPWAIVAVPLILAMRPRDWWKASVVGATIAAAWWLPFILTDTDTIEAMRPYAVVAPASVLHLFGMGLDDGPGWLRPVQLGCALSVGAITVWRGRWTALLCAGIAVRLLLDPGVFAYYTAGLLMAALLWDLTRSRLPTPFWTAATFWLLDVATMLSLSDTLESVLRLVLIVALLGSVLLPRRASIKDVEAAAR